MEASGVGSGGLEHLDASGVGGGGTTNGSVPDSRPLTSETPKHRQGLWGRGYGIGFPRLTSNFGLGFCFGLGEEAGDEAVF